MLPRWFRDGSNEFTFVFRYSFRNNLRVMDRIGAFVFLPWIVVFVPYDWLACAANKAVFLALGDRFAVDYDYLLANRPDFADAYVGGVMVQLGIVVAGVAVHSYFAVTSKDIVFVADRKWLYLGWISFTIAFFAFGAFTFSHMTDFGLSAEISWFADNPEASRRLVPVAPNSAAFILTGMFLSGAAVVSMVLMQTIVIVSTGRRVKFDDIRGERNDGR